MGYITRSLPLKESLNLFSPRARFKIASACVLQSALGMLDLLGVISLGILTTLAASEMQLYKPSWNLNSILKIIHLSNFTLHAQMAFLSAVAVLLLAGRTIFSIIFTKKILSFLSLQAAQISAQLLGKLLSRPEAILESGSSQNVAFSINKGVEIIALQVIGAIIVLVSDLSLVVIMLIGLLIFNPVTAILMILIYAAMLLFLNRAINAKAKSLGSELSELTLLGTEKVVETILNYREVIVKNRSFFYSCEIEKIRTKIAGTLMEINYIPYLSKYVLELSVLVGSFSIVLFQLLFQDITHAIPTLAIFLASGARIAPAILRGHQSYIQILRGLGEAGPTLMLAGRVADVSFPDPISNDLNSNYSDFNPDIVIKNLNYTYPDTLNPTLVDISLVIPAGSLVAIVGPSGAGKTTLVDLILGVLSPNDGEILISNNEPLDAIKKWSGAISYVSQDISLINGSIRQNVTLGYPPDAHTDLQVNNALRIAYLDEYVESLELGIDSHLGERGAKISGGQAQRLGIARAVITDPQLIILDEATSALDSETESKISDSINMLRGRATIITIAHRLSSIKGADLIIYLDRGKIISVGTFDELYESNNSFHEQVNLMRA